MEETLSTQPEQEQKLALTEFTITYLTEIRKWAHFLSIMGFISIGLMVIGSLFVGLAFSSLPIGNQDIPFPGTGFAFFYLLFALLYFFPVYYLYQFSVKMKTALLEKSESYLETSFMFLKSNFKFVGILTIVMLALYSIILLVAGTFGIISVMQ